MKDSLVPQMEAVREQFEKWRNTRANRREPIPGELWRAAVELCRVHPITRVSHCLRLSYPDLKKHFSAAMAQPSQFMEIDMGCLTGSWLIECTRSDGATLRLSVNGKPPVVEVILRDFLS
jgi:hypothetical protein